MKGQWPGWWARQGKGDIFFVPEGWRHLIVNEGDTVSLSFQARATNRGMPRATSRLGCRFRHEASGKSAQLAHANAEQPMRLHAQRECAAGTQSSERAHV